jgi:single-strand DNA-binding protein
MNSINLTGRLTADPETRSARATDVARFRLAIGRRRGREGEDRGAVYVDVVTFGGLARSCGEHLAKGRQVAVSGRLELDEWQTDGGERRSRHKVVADEVGFLDRRHEDGESEEAA